MAETVRVQGLREVTAAFHQVDRGGSRCSARERSGEGGGTCRGDRTREGDANSSYPGVLDGYGNDAGF